MKPGYIIIALFILVGSVFASMGMDYPYITIAVLVIYAVIYWVWSNASVKNRERRHQEELFQMHMRNKKSR